MIVFRLSKAKFAKSLSGIGAEKYGGRWNNRGTAMIYTSGSRALCTLEIAVHTPLGNIPTNYKLITIEIPDDASLAEVDIDQLPTQWNSSPHGNKTQEMGDAFITAEEHLVLKVPAAVVQGEYNYLINPAHPSFACIKILAVEDFEFDKRIFKR